MATEEERKTTVYREVFKLMEAKKIKAIKNWQKDQLAFAKREYKPCISADLFSSYEEALKEYTEVLETSYATYHTPGISNTRKENIIDKLIRGERSHLANAIRIMDKERKEYNSSRPTSTPTKTPEAPQKANWWKRIFLTTLFLGGGLYATKHLRSDGEAKEGDKPSERLEQRVRNLEELAGSEAGNGAVQKGNTWSVSVKEKELKEAEHAYKLARIEAETAALKAKTHESKNNMRVSDARTEREVRLNGQRAAQEEAYARWYINEKGEAIVRDQNATRLNSAQTKRRINDESLGEIRDWNKTNRDTMYTVWYINEKGQAMQLSMSATELKLVENQRLMAQGRLGIATDISDAMWHLNSNNNSIIRDNSKTGLQATLDRNSGVQSNSGTVKKVRDDYYNY